MKKLVLILALLGSSLLVINAWLLLVDANMWQFRKWTYLTFLFTFFLSFIFLFTKQWRPFVIHLIALAIVLLLAPRLQPDVNYVIHKEQREQIIQMLVDGKLQKKEIATGFFRYPTPAGYENAVGSSTVRAAMHSDEEYYVYFDSADVALFDIEGYAEGFIYSSTGEFPSPKKFNRYEIYKKVEENWFFVSSRDSRVRGYCNFVCSPKIYERVASEEGN